MATKTYWTNDVEYMGNVKGIPYKIATSTVQVEETNAFGRKVFIVKVMFEGKERRLETMFANHFKSYRKDYLFDSKEEALKNANNTILGEIQRDITILEMGIKRLYKNIKENEQVLKLSRKHEQIILKRIEKNK